MKERLKDLVKKQDIIIQKIKRTGYKRNPNTFFKELKKKGKVYYFLMQKIKF